MKTKLFTSRLGATLIAGSMASAAVPPLTEVVRQIWTACQDVSNTNEWI